MFLIVLYEMLFVLKTLRLGSWLWTQASSSKQEVTLLSQSRLVSSISVFNLVLLMFVLLFSYSKTSFSLVCNRQTVLTQRFRQKQCFRVKWRSCNRSSSSQQSKWRLSHLSVIMPVSSVHTVRLRRPRLLLRNSFLVLGFCSSDFSLGFFTQCCVCNRFEPE